MRTRRVAVVSMLCATVLGVGPAEGLIDSDAENIPAQTNSDVQAIAYVKGRAYLGGSFTAPRNHLAAVRTSTGTLVRSFKPTVSAPVIAVAARKGLVVVGTENRVIAFEALTGARRWAVSADGVRSLAIWRGRVFVGAARAIRHSVPRLAALSARSGAIIRDWDRATPARAPLALTITGGFLYVGQSLPTGAAHNRVLAMSVRTGTSKRGFRGDSRYVVLAMDSDSRGVYLAVGGPGGHCTRLGLQTGRTRWSKRANGNVQAVTATASSVFCGGHFGPASGAPPIFGDKTRSKLAAVNKATGKVRDFHPRIGPGYGVLALATSKYKVLVGGAFTMIGNDEHRHYAQFR